jgi:hypothetical protein
MNEPTNDTQPPDIDALLLAVASAFDGRCGDDAARIARVGMIVIETLVRKNRDYGGSVWRRPALCPSMPIESAILCRMSDKVSRLANLSGREHDAAVAESIDDTMIDLAGYAMLYVARPADEHD